MLNTKTSSLFSLQIARFRKYCRHNVTGSARDTGALSIAAELQLFSQYHSFMVDDDMMNNDSDLTPWQILKFRVRSTEEKSLS